MYPTLVAKNQFGETQDLTMLGGSGFLSCDFIVDSANGNGLGLRSLKVFGYPAVANVFMHTSSTPASGNPNPPAGYILVQFNQPFAGYQSGTYGFVSPLSGTPISVTSGLSLHGVYTIASVGTTTAAQWQTLGLPTNLTPTVGQTFVAITASAGSGTGVVEAPLATGSGNLKIEALGDPNQGVQTNNGTGGSMVLVCLSATDSSTTTLVATAPIDGSVVGLTFRMLSVPAPLI